VRRRRPLLFPLTIALAVIAAALVLTRSWWLPALGWALVRDEGPAKADIAVVLGGDLWGNRIKKGGDLVRQGYVPAALVSGPPGFYDQHESEPEIAYAVRQGYPRQYFIAFPDEARSTQDEAAMILPELRRRNVHRVLVVTSDYHSRRAGRIFRAAERTLGGGIEILMVATPDTEFHPDSWWRSRQGQKIAFMEWTKTLSSAIGF
jgi:uncharacterized SAM-binding protein YcdF (DUF218 family)